jgi:hypothetical protein
MMSLFPTFRAVILISLFFCGMASMAMAQSVAELESAVRSCQDSWRSMGNRYQQQCGQISEVTRHANETKARLDKAEIPLSVRSKHAKCQDLYNECHEVHTRWFANYDACRAAGGTVEACANTQAHLQLGSQNNNCWNRYDSCRDSYDKENDEWQASVRKQRDAYNADLQKIQACRQLEGQYRSIVESCTKLEMDLNTARAGRQQASVRNCVTIDGPRTDGHNVTFTAVVDQNTQANLLNMQGASGFSWLVDGKAQQSTSSTLTMQAPAGGTHQIRVQFWTMRTGSALPQPGMQQVLCDSSKPFHVNQTQDRIPQGRIGTGSP